MGSECVRFVQVFLPLYTFMVGQGLMVCSNGCGLDIGVKDGKVVGVRGRATDRVNKGRLGPKGLNGFVFPLYNALNSPDVLVGGQQCPTQTA